MLNYICGVAFAAAPLAWEQGPSASRVRPASGQEGLQCRGHPQVLDAWIHAVALSILHHGGDWL